MSSDSSLHELSPAIARSRIFVHGGFLLLPSLLPADDLNQLEGEANYARPAGRRNVLPVASGKEERGGNPDRAFTTAAGGPVQWGIFASPAMLARLAQVCGLELSPLGGGSYSFYEQSGDFLGLHRDIVDCDLAVITCVRARGEEAAAGRLLVYSNYMNAPLTSARSAGKAGATPVPMGRGESVALLGGFVPHEVTPMLPGQERIVSVMCYRVGGDQAYKVELNT